MPDILDANHQPSAPWSKLFKVQVSFFVAELLTILVAFIAFLVGFHIVKSITFLYTTVILGSTIYGLLISAKYVALLRLRKKDKWIHFLSSLGVWITAFCVLWLFLNIKYYVLYGGEGAVQTIRIIGILYGLAHLFLILPYILDVEYRTIRLHIIYNIVCLSFYMMIVLPYSIGVAVAGVTKSTFFQLTAAALIASIVSFMRQLHKLNYPKFRVFYLWVVKSFLWLLWVAVHYLFEA